MQTAKDFLNRLRDIVENLPRRPDVANRAAWLLDDHNQEMQDLALSHQPQSVCAMMLQEARDRLILKLTQLKTA